MSDATDCLSRFSAWPVSREPPGAASSSARTSVPRRTSRAPLWSCLASRVHRPTPSADPPSGSPAYSLPCIWQSPRPHHPARPAGHPSPCKRVVSRAPDGPPRRRHVQHSCSRSAARQLGRGRAVKAVISSHPRQANVCFDATISELSLTGIGRYPPLVEAIR